jgi:hypothetical protein
MQQHAQRDFADKTRPADQKDSATVEDFSW